SIGYSNQALPLETRENTHGRLKAGRNREKFYPFELLSLRLSAVYLACATQKLRRFVGFSGSKENLRTLTLTDSSNSSSSSGSSSSSCPVFVPLHLDVGFRATPLRINLIASCSYMGEPREAARLPGLALGRSLEAISDFRVRRLYVWRQDCVRREGLQLDVICP
ncbi:hypothetical protein ElyMa_000596400, partial [Elysia marginata]